ncbi:cyclin-D4-1-like [Malus sylvestris]|uniref:cyclin-D4-1-like n=1 Tax=Malus sylvestris TaxID=3752 RepID=UPI0021ACC9FD|nr:cyclin-D4-1-like [Malus sylvestris]
MLSSYIKLLSLPMASQGAPMADSFDSATSNLLCAENSNTCFDDLDSNATDDLGHSPSISHKTNQDPNFDHNCRSKSMIDFPSQSEVGVTEMVKRESEHLPTHDYLRRLRSGELDLSTRREALDWIWKAHSHYSFGPLCVWLSMNYWDRFLSLYELPRGKTWALQLLAVACLSIAAKVEETNVPQSVDLQVGDPKFVFEAKTILRMELLVMSTLKWRMQVCTPYTFIDYFLGKICDDQHPLTSSIGRSQQLVLSTIRGIHFLEFRPSEIAAAVAICISGEIQAQSVDVDKAISCFVHVDKERVLKCIELMKDLSLISDSANRGSASGPSVPPSPNGVLDAACLSCKSDEFIVGSCANSSHSSPDIKRRKPDNQS